jgi:hypothetical protein
LWRSERLMLQFAKYLRQAGRFSTEFVPVYYCVEKPPGQFQIFCKLQYIHTCVRCGGWRCKNVDEEECKVIL